MRTSDDQETQPDLLPSGGCTDASVLQARYKVTGALQDGTESS